MNPRIWNHKNFRSAACARPIFRFLSFRPRLANRPKSRTLSQTSQTPRSIRTHAIYNLHTVNSVTDQQSPKPTRDRDVKEAEVPTAPSSRFLSWRGRSHELRPASRGKKENPGITRLRSVESRRGTLFPFGSNQQHNSLCKVDSRFVRGDRRQLISPMPSWFYEERPNCKRQKNRRWSRIEAQ